MTQWLTDTLIATSGLLLLVLLIRGAVARHFGASVSYWLWLLPAARLFMPARTEVVAAPAVAMPAEFALSAPEAIILPQVSAVAAQPIDWTSVGISIWLGGAALLFILQMLRYVALRDELLGDAVEIERIGNIRVVQTDRISGPLAFGLFRRYIAVPDHFTRLFNDEERSLALAHELAHHRSGDLFVNLAAFIFLCLQWFNPLAWIAWSAFRFDQEAACDARVLTGKDVGTRQSYGRALARAASSDRLPTLAMAMAQNGSHTIIERLRRVMMKDTSKRRLLAGRAAIFLAAAIALPLTATVVPVFAEDKSDASSEAKPKRMKTKIVIMKGKDGEPVKVDVSGDADTPFVKTIQKDGKTIVLRSSKELDQSELEKLLSEVERDTAEAAADAEQAGKDAEAAGRDAGKAAEEAQPISKIHVFTDKDFANLVPEIDVREMRRNCKKGQNVKTDVTGFDSSKKGRVRISVCGAGMASAVRVEAIQGLREALNEIRDSDDMPEKIRASVVSQLQGQIDQMEAQLADDNGNSEDEV
jgi:bla regulator protein blaR1